jgi:hypothetical protein
VKNLFSFLVVLTISHLVPPAFSQEKTVDSVKAVVGDTPILASEIDAIEKEIKKSPSLLEAYRLGKNYTRDQLLERLIEEAIIKQKVKELGIEITDMEVENQISQIAKQYGISKSQLESSLKKEGIDPSAYRKNIKTQIERRDFFDRTLRRGGGISDVELRQLYDRTAPKSYHLFVLNASNETPESTLVSIRNEVVSRKTSLEDSIKKHSASDQGWISSEDLEKNILEAIQGAANKAPIVGPIKMGRVMRLIFIAGEKSGTEEDFEKSKSSLMAKAQAEDFERRLGFWMESQKRELQIIKN